MPSLPTALLRHVDHGPLHYDWLLAIDDAGPLLTFRVDRPAADWLDAGRLKLIPLGPHRRCYLDYEGPISGDRGSVTRADSGTHRPDLWTDDHIVTTVAWQALTLRMELTRQSPERWLAIARSEPR